MNAGCNTAIGAYTLTDGTLTVGPMIQTRMACEDALMAQDTWIVTMLEARRTVVLDGDNIDDRGERHDDRAGRRRRRGRGEPRSTGVGGGSRR